MEKLLWRTFPRGTLRHLFSKRGPHGANAHSSPRLRFNTSIGTAAGRRRAPASLAERSLSCAPALARKTLGNDLRGRVVLGFDTRMLALDARRDSNESCASTSASEALASSQRAAIFLNNSVTTSLYALPQYRSPLMSDFLLESNGARVISRAFSSVSPQESQSSSTTSSSAKLPPSGMPSDASLAKNDPSPLSSPASQRSENDAPREVSGRSTGSSAKSQSFDIRAYTQNIRKARKRMQRPILERLGDAMRKLPTHSRAAWRAIVDFAADFSRRPIEKSKEMYTAGATHAKFYWTSTKLFWVEVQTARSIFVKQRYLGKELTRRERNQLTRVMADLYFLPLVAVLIAIPGLEALIPVLLKFFPKMIPSFLKTSDQRKDEAKERLRQSLEHAALMQDVLHEITEKKMTKVKSASDVLQEWKQYIQDLELGQTPSLEKTLRVSQFFRDEIAIDNMPQERLRELCGSLNISEYGSEETLRYRIFKRVAEIRSDDRELFFENLDNWDRRDLADACRARGIPVFGSTEVIRNRLSTWIDLSLSKKAGISLNLFKGVLVPKRKLYGVLAFERDQKFRGEHPQ